MPARLRNPDAGNPMTLAALQSPRAVVMIRPHHFTPNPATAIDNSFQSVDLGRAASVIADEAYAEVTRAAERIEAAGVTVHLFEDEGAATPDSVFPNNWFSTHADGRVALYPMFSPSRRAERRLDVIEMLETRYDVREVIDFSGLEAEGVYLEGTGAMVLDHVGRVAYACRSNRADAVALERFCARFGFTPVMFDALDANSRAIYHTNVMMCVGTRFCLIGLEAIPDKGCRAEVRERLAAGGREVIELTQAQLAEFAGNALELGGRDGPVLALSSRALAALTPARTGALERWVTLLPLDVPTIELAGGSVRCMLAGVHLAPRP